jgi:HEAT repeat protein
MKRALAVLFALSVIFTEPTYGETQPAPQPTASSRAEELVRELRQFPAALQPAGRTTALEERRTRVFQELRMLGPASLPALIAGLADPDVQIRRNVALFLNIAAGKWSASPDPRLNIRPALSALITASHDADSRVRGLAAQAIGTIGPDAARAVPALIALLANPDEGSRNSACIGLTGIGPRAKDALPALRKALSDPSPDVQHFAQRAISAIEAP